MSYGLRVTNPSGQLVFSDSAPGYAYIGKPAVYSAGSVGYGVLNPYIFRITTGDLRHPIAFVKPAVGAIVRVIGVVPVSSGVWDIAVHSISSYNDTTDPTYIAVVAPEVYVFSPKLTPSGVAFGAQLFDAAGAMLFDFGYKLMWLRQVVGFPGYTSSFTWAYRGNNYILDSIPRDTSIPDIAISGVSISSGNVDSLTLGEPLDTLAYGWAINPSTGNIERRMYWTGSEKPNTPPDNGDVVYMQAWATTALVISTTGL